MSEPDPPLETQLEEPLRTDARSIFYRFAAALRSGAISAGDVASLRRMDPLRLDSPGFWKLAGMYLDRVLPGEADDRRRKETAWAAVAISLAHLGDLQQSDRRLGRALADAGYSELRFVRLLRADEERLLDELPQLARYLAAKSVSADFSGAALLLVGSRPENSRRHLARDYYTALSKQDA